MGQSKGGKWVRVKGEMGQSKGGKWGRVKGENGAE